MEHHFTYSEKTYTYVVHRVQESLKTTENTSEPSERPAEITDKWLASEISKAYLEDTTRASREGKSLLVDALDNVQGLTKNADILILFGEDKRMIGKVDIYVNESLRMLNMLFLYGFGRVSGSGDLLIRAAALHSAKTFGPEARLMAINPLSPLYPRLLHYKCRCVLLDEPAEPINVNIVDAIPANTKDTNQISEVLVSSMHKCIENHTLIPPLDKMFSEDEIGFGAILQVSSILSEQA